MDEPAYGPWRVLRSLGRGGMAEVYLAEHATLGVHGALKRIAEPDPRLAAVLRREARAQAAVSHPNLLRIHDVGEAGGGSGELDGPWLVMEVATGSLEDGGAQTWTQARSMLLAVLDGLAHAHARGLIHRDLKPANVLLVGGRAKIADFGLAHQVRLARSTLSRAGTPAYMAPEQTRGAWRDFGPATDLYAVGRMAIELLAGCFPTEPGALEAALEVAPDGFEGWVRHATAEDPARRFRFAAHMRAALDALPDRARREGTVRARAHAVTEESRLTELAGPAARAPSAEEDLPAPALPSWSPDPSAWTADEPTATLAGVGAALAGLRDVGLIGRDAERRQLGALLADVARTRRARLVLLLGVGGIGKTRLARWLGERAHELGLAGELVVTHGEAPGPADGVAGAAARWFGCLGLDRDGVATRLQRATWLSDHDRRALLAAVAPDPERDLCSWADMRSALRRWLRGLARELPLVVTLEDLQWGAETLDVLLPLLDDPDCPLLLVGAVREEALATRPSERGRLEALAAQQPVLRIGPLPSADLSLLAGTLLGLSLTAADALASGADGLPLHIVEVVRLLASGAALRSGPGGYDLAEGAAPGDLKGVWAARLGGWASDRRVRLAAVLGVTFEPEVWAEACEASGLEADPALLDALGSAGLIRHPPGGLPTFVHASLRDFLLARCRPRVRASLESACADALASRPARALRRGLHLLAAGRGPEGAAALLDAAERAVRVGDLAGAAGTVALATSVLGDDDGQVLFLRAQIARFSGDWAESRRLALAALERPATKPEAAVRRLVMAALSHHHDIDASDAFYQRAFAEARETGQARAGAFAAAVRAANLISRRVPAEEALATAEAALPLVRPLERPTVLVVRELALMQLGRYPDVIRASEETVAVAREAGMRVVEGPSWLNRGAAHHFLGQLDEAEAAYRQAAAMEDALGLQGGRDARVNLAVLHLDRGRDDVARAGLVEELARMGPDQLLMRRSALAFLTPAAVGAADLWRATLGELEELTARVRFATPGSARLLELAGDRHPDPFEAARARRLAAEDWALLGRVADAARVQAKLGDGPA